MPTIMLVLERIQEEMKIVAQAIVDNRSIELMVVDKNKYYVHL